MITNEIAKERGWKVLCDYLYPHLNNFGVRLFYTTADDGTFPDGTYASIIISTIKDDNYIELPVIPSLLSDIASKLMLPVKWLAEKDERAAKDEWFHSHSWDEKGNMIK